MDGRYFLGFCGLCYSDFYLYGLGRGLEEDESKARKSGPEYPTLFHLYHDHCRNNGAAYMKLDEALEVLNETSNLDLELRRRAAIIDKAVKDVAVALVNMVFIEHKIKVIDGGEDDPAEVDRKAKNAVKNIFKSAASERATKGVHDQLKTAIKAAAGSLR